MPLRAFLFLFLTATLSLTALAFADDCSCPVVQCEPCQHKIILGAQMKECKNTPAVVCQKVVCENVENYFHCLANAPDLYIPPQDPSRRYTEPRYSPLVEKPAAPARFEFKAPVAPVAPRLPASVTAPVKPVSTDIIVSRLKGEVFEGRKALHKTKSYKSKVLLSAKKNAQVKVEYAGDEVWVDLQPGEPVDFSIEEGVLVLRQAAGELRGDVKKSSDLVVVDLGEWRFGKRSGEFDVLSSGAGVRIGNFSGEGMLRKKAVISASTKIPANTTVQFTGTELYTLAPFQTETAMTYVLNEASGDDSRAPAADSFCQAPAGQYEQCAWKCFGAAKDAKACAGDAAQTHCVRFTCAADGQWKLPTVVSGGECSVDKVQVSLCH